MFQGSVPASWRIGPAPFVLGGVPKPAFVLGLSPLTFRLSPILLSCPKAAQASTGAPTAVRAVPATPMGSVSLTLVCATAKPTAGVAAASSSALAALTGVATRRPARATARRVGGQPSATTGASATQWQPAVTRPRATAFAMWAGGAAAAASAAIATAHRAPRSRVAAPAGQAGGALSAGSGASVCEAAVAWTRASAPAHPASTACAVSYPAPRASTVRSAATGEQSGWERARGTCAQWGRVGEKEVEGMWTGGEGLGRKLQCFP